MKFTHDEERRILAPLVPMLDAAAFIELKERYAEPHRHYHTWDHALAVLSWVNAVAPNDRAMQLAALYHDAIYRVGAADNEAMSCDLLCDHGVNKLWFRSTQSGDDEPLPGRACRYILATARHGKINRGDVDERVATFLDCDMVSFGEPRPDIFKATDELVRAELLTAFTAEQVAIGRNAFLSALTHDRRVFLTDRFRYPFEAQARNNIAGLLL